MSKRETTTRIDPERVKFKDRRLSELSRDELISAICYLLEKREQLKKEIAALKSFSEMRKIADSLCSLDKSNSPADIFEQIAQNR